MATLDDVLDLFEERWRTTDAPSLRDFLSEHRPPDQETRRELLHELIALDLEYRARTTSGAETLSASASETHVSDGVPSALPTLQDYADLLPDLTDDPQAWSGLIAEEYRVRQRWGDRPPLEEYIERYGNDETLTSALQAVARELNLDRQPEVSEEAEHELPPLPRSFGRYQLVERLGRGGMGDVYRAFDTHLDREVALKIPRLDRESSQTSERFLNEARAAATLRHLHICPVFDTGSVDGTPFLTMAYIEGRTLREVWDAVQRPAVSELLMTLAKVARALQVAHDAGIVHRDLKPGNVLLDLEGEPVVTDFGLARRTALDDARLTRSGELVGSPAYMSPEQIDINLGEAGPASDVYGLGVMLFEGLTGQRPFSGGVGQVTAAVLRDAPPRPTEFRSNIDPELEALCLAMLAKAPEERLASMSLVAERLEAIHERLTVTTPAIAGNGSGGRSRKWLFAGFGAAAVLLAALLIRIQTDRGTLVIRSEVPGVEVTIRQGDDVVDELTVRSGEKQTTIASGTYEIVLSGIDTDGISVSPTNVTLRRGKTEVVTVQRVASKPDENTPPVPLTAPKPSGVSDAWVQSVQELSADDQLAAVVEKLQELNPDFDGELLRVEYQGLRPPHRFVRHISLSTRHITDIFPLRTLRSLSYVEFYGREPGSLKNGQLADLSPLADLEHLDSLVCYQNPLVTDLEPLRGHQLRMISLRECGVTSLEPLRGMPITHMTIVDNPVSDLRPLADMQTLTQLQIWHTRITDLSPLAGTSLEFLDAHSLDIEDLSPLANLPLKKLLLKRTADLAPLANLPLENLTLLGATTEDLKFLEKLPLKSLNISRSGLTTLAPLADISTLQELNCDFCRDLRDLAPLGKLNLTTLHIEHTQVADLTPLTGLPLEELALRGTSVTDLSPLRDMPLRTIWLPKQQASPADLDILRSIKTLKTINDEPAAKFLETRAASE